jgi:hypothetical protein
VIQELLEAQKEVIDLAFFKGMSQHEIAAKREISLEMVKTRLHLARRKLHKSLMPIDLGKTFFVVHALDLPESRVSLSTSSIFRLDAFSFGAHAPSSRPFSLVVLKRS